MKIAGAVALGVGVAATLAACGTSKPTGPMADLTDTFMKNLHPEPIRGVRQLSVTGDARRDVKTDDGRLQGTYDGTRLLTAADAHAYGTPQILDAAIDKQGDGFATFNEVRQVLRHFDADASDGFDATEARAFESEVGIRWIPAGE